MATSYPERGEVRKKDPLFVVNVLAVNFESDRQSRLGGNPNTSETSEGISRKWQKWRLSYGTCQILGRNP